MDRTVAVKVLPSHLSENPEARARFEREAKTISTLNHPNICVLYDVGHQDGVDFLVMEYLEGATLAEPLVKDALPLDEALEIAVKIADALDKAHSRGIVHRDLKPANIMLTASGPKLVDFGLAKLVLAQVTSGDSEGATEQKDLTRERATLGTLQYMAPEQLEGESADARTDLFAFGAVLHEMLTGKKVFEGKSQASLIAAILERTPEPVSAIQPVSPRTLDWAVARCLAKDPAERWESARDVKEVLSWIGKERALGGGSPPGPRPAPQTQTRRRREPGCPGRLRRCPPAPVHCSPPVFHRTGRALGSSAGRSLRRKARRGGGPLGLSSGRPRRRHLARRNIDRFYRTGSTLLASDGSQRGRSGA